MRNGQSVIQMWRWLHGHIDSMSDSNYMIRLRASDPDNPYCIVPKRLAGERLELGDRVKILVRDKEYGSVVKE